MSDVGFGRVVDLITDKAGLTDFKIGLEAIEGGTGQLISGIDGDYEGDGVAFAPGDVLFGKLRPYLAKTWLADRAGAAVGDFHVYRPHAERLDARYLQYVTLSSSFLDPVASSVYGAKMPRASWDFVRNIPLHLPPLAEQRAITDYLDHETAKIDVLVAKQQQLIARFYERRIAEIAAAVVHGLDPEAAQKPAAADWLDTIPASWTEKRLKWSVESVQVGAWGEDPHRDDTDVTCVRVADFDRPRLSVGQAETRRWLKPSDVEPRLLREGDLLLEKSGGTPANPVGFVAYVGRVLEPTVCSNFIARMRLVPDQDPRYWLYAHATSHATRLTGRSYKQTTGIQNLDQHSYFDELFPFPPPAEQRAIARHLDMRTAEIDVLIGKVQRLVSLAKERRAALITAAVTGELDVRTAA